MGLFIELTEQHSEDIRLINIKSIRMVTTGLVKKLRRGSAIYGHAGMGVSYYIESYEKVKELIKKAES